MSAVSLDLGRASECGLAKVRGRRFRCLGFSLKFDEFVHAAVDSIVSQDFVDQWHRSCGTNR